MPTAILGFGKSDRKTAPIPRPPTLRFQSLRLRRSLHQTDSSLGKFQFSEAVSGLSARRFENAPPSSRSSEARDNARKIREGVYGGQSIIWKCKRSEERRVGKEC